MPQIGAIRLEIAYVTVDTVEVTHKMTPKVGIRKFSPIPHRNEWVSDGKNHRRAYCSVRYLLSGFSLTDDDRMYDICSCCLPTDHIDPSPHITAAYAGP